MENGSQITYRNSKTLEVPAREKRIVQNVYKLICQTTYILMQYNLPFL
jgi:hypothetical protein